MSKQIKAAVKIQLPGGGANPSLIGKEMGPHGVNLMKFCTEFNTLTAPKKGELVPAVVTVYVDKSFSIVIKTAPVSYLLKKEAKLEKGASKIGKEIVGSVTKAQVKKIAEIKMPDVNTMSIESMCKTVEGTARSMGIKIID